MSLSSSPSIMMNTKPSKEIAMEFFHNYIIPRRTPDEVMMKRYALKKGKKKRIYRKVLPTELNRGEMFPLTSVSAKKFAPFGMGIGLYFLQLVVLFTACTICGLIMIPAIIEYGKADYGVGRSAGGLYFKATAACDSPIKVNATIGCSDGQIQCEVNYRPHCELPFSAAAADLVMSLVFMIVILVSKLFEAVVEEELDEAIQTAKDYSILCNDPPKQADDPDEWYKYFSRYGVIRYITVVRDNHKLLESIVRLHTIVMELEALQDAAVDNVLVLSKEKYDILDKKIMKLKRRVERQCRRTYAVNRVFVTYELEQAQRHCIRELEVADYIALFNIQDNQGSKLFRNEVLDVEEPAEPDTIIWENLKIAKKDRLYYDTRGFIVTAGCIVAIFFIVSSVAHGDPLNKSIVIAAVDLLLPMLFEAIVNWTYPLTEGIRQSKIQVRLYLSRLLLAVLFPYFFTSWHKVIEREFIESILTTQIILCLLGPSLAVFDVGGLISRHCIGPIFAKTQGELNTYFTGSMWSLADRYTIIAKILTVSMFYSLLNPISMFIAAFSFGIVFYIDRYLLLRKLKPTCMLSAEIAVRLRQQAILCVTLHMIASLRFIYSWPMDDVWRRDDGSYEVVNKIAPISLFTYTRQKWMTTGQQRILQPYQIATILVLIIVVSIWVIQPICNTIYHIFFIDDHLEVGDSQNIDFSTVPFIPVYCPTITFHNNTYMCSYLDNVRDNHKASFIRPLPNDKDNISDYVPIEYQKYVLSIVKYYGDGDDNMLSVVDKAEQGLFKGMNLPPPMPIQDAMLMNRIEAAPEFSFVTQKRRMIDQSISQQHQPQQQEQQQQLPPSFSLLSPTTTSSSQLSSSSSVIIPIIPQELSQKLNEQTIANETRRNQNKTRRPENKSRRIVRSREVEGYGYAPLATSSALPLLQLNRMNSTSIGSSIHPMVSDNKNHNEELKDSGRMALKPNRVLLKPLQRK